MSNNLDITAYVSGSWNKRDEILEFENDLESLGVDVISTWRFRAKSEHNYGSKVCAEDLSRDAVINTKEIREADVFIAIILDPEHHHWGTLSLLGYALGTFTKVVVYCPDPCSQVKRNHILWHPEVRVFDKYDEMIAHLQIVTKYMHKKRRIIDVDAE